MASRSPSALNKEAGGSGANEASSLLADILAAIKELETTPETWDQKVHVDVAERLCAAAVAGDTGVVRAVLKNHPLAVKCQNAGGLTALHLAAMHGHADTAAYLLNFHADVNALDNRGLTPLDHCPTDAGELSMTGNSMQFDMQLNSTSVADILKSQGGQATTLSSSLNDEVDYSICSPGNRTSSYRDVDLSEPYDVQSPQDDDDWEEIAPIPAVALADGETVSFDDPNTGNPLVFRIVDGRMLYEVKNAQRPQITRIDFAETPPRLMFPNIGTCATLPNDKALPQILAGIKYMADKSGVHHDIPTKLKKRRDTTNWNSETGSFVLVNMSADETSKTFTSQRLCRWLNWKGVRARIFNSKPEQDKAAVKAMIEFFRQNPSAVGILCVERCTVDDRKRLISMLGGYHIPTERIVFLEAVLSNAKLIDECERAADEKEGDAPAPPPTTSTPPSKRAPIYSYDSEGGRNRRFQSLTERTDGALSWAQFMHPRMHVRGTVRINRVQGHLAQKLLFFLLNLHPVSTTTYLVRTGECMNQIVNKVGGNTDLTDKGWQHAAAVRRFFNLPQHRHEHMQVFSSTMRRAVDTQACFQGERFSNVQYTSLNEINAAECENMTPDEIQANYPQLWHKRTKDKYYYGWPRGESYHNMNQRLEQVFLDVHQSSDPVLIIGHLDVCRGLYAYLSDMLPELCAYLTLPQSQVYEFTYGERGGMDITAYDISSLSEDAKTAGVTMSNRPNDDYLTSTPAEEPTKTAAPQLPAHVSDIISYGQESGFRFHHHHGSDDDITAQADP
ncbi:6-phosphofructo-2-kinase/fructose-2 [Diplonema papillatum]|nr:6-phosphofructo-2-kinase/fructose-2 [Diplonema papillatum]